MGEIKDLSHRHHAIAEWLIANPHETLGKCAKTFGITQPWLSQIIHSDAFQAYYHRLLEGYVDQRIMPLRDKLNNVAHKAVDALNTSLDTPEFIPPKELASIADRALGRLGYGTGGGGNPASQTNLTQVNNYYTVDQETLARARDRYNSQFGEQGQERIYGGGGEGSAGARREQPALEAEARPAQAAEHVPAGGEDRKREADGAGAGVRAGAAEASGDEGAGD